jgi:hypothetical protein
MAAVPLGAQKWMTGGAGMLTGTALYAMPGVATYWGTGPCGWTEEQPNKRGMRAAIANWMRDRLLISDWTTSEQTVFCQTNSTGPLC